MTPEVQMQALHAGTLAEHLGVRFASVTQSQVVCELDMAPHLTTPDGGVHGAILIALADIAGAAGARANLPDGMRTSTFQSASNMVGSIREGTLVATAVPVHLGSRTMVWATRVTCKESGKLLCNTTQTQMTLPAG